MRRHWLTRALLIAGLLALAPACGDSGSGGESVSESPNLGETGSVKATAAEGGELSLPESGVTLSIPAGALAEDTEISAEVVSKKDLPEAANLGGNVVEFGPDGLTFLAPVKLEMDLAGSKVPEGAEVSIAWLDEDKNEWVDLPGSKLADGKVSANTMHFTKFVIRFVVNEDGEVVQDEGQCDTSGFTACGGDIEGTWDFSVGCVTLPGSLGSEDDPAAKCISVDAVVDFSGEVTFSKGSFTGTTMNSFSFTQKIDKACLADAFSQSPDAMGMTITADQLMCDQFVDEPDPGEEPATVEEVGDECLISQPEKTEMDTIDGTYTVEGNTLTTTDNDVEEGEVAEPEPQEYCIKGNTLTLVFSNEDGSKVMLTAERR